jgi:hypothetical protein
LLALSKLTDVVEVKFILTIISGDCLLTVSRDKRDHNITDPELDVAMNDTLTYSTNLSNQYYVRVVAYAPSYYSLTAIVKRKNGKSDDNKTTDSTIVPLNEGISQMFYLDNTQL